MSLYKNKLIFFVQSYNRRSVALDRGSGIMNYRAKQNKERRRKEEKKLVRQMAIQSKERRS